MPNFVYLIHLDEPLHHARHYLGATTNLEARLNAHYWGYGCALLAHVVRHGGTWTLAKIWHTETPWSAEQLAKRQHNAPRFCPLCQKNPRRLKNAQSYPITELPTQIRTKRSADGCTNTPPTESSSRTPKASDTSYQTSTQKSPQRQNTQTDKTKTQCSPSKEHWAK